jgi:hypothetical protein
MVKAIFLKTPAYMLLAELDGMHTQYLKKIG